MKKMTRLLMCVMAAVMLLSSACAQGVECAAQMVDLKDWKHYPSFAWDEETGDWSLQSYQADALVARFWAYGIRNSSRTVVFHLAAEGSSLNGVWTPVLRFYHMDGETINARAVSLLVNGERYDLAASSSEVKNGRYTAECITVPLNEEGMQVAAKLMQAEMVTVRLIGEEMYTAEIDLNATTERRRMEGSSIAQLENGMALLTELGVQSYGLWDLSADAWESKYGYRPAVTVGSVGETLCEETLTDKLSMVVYESSGDAAVKAQESLIEYGFLMGAPYWQFDEHAVNAVLRAQKYLDRVPTGCYDEALDQALAMGRQAQENSVPSLQKLGTAAEVAVERFWFADGVSASRSMESLRSVANEDNVFIAADGVIRNPGVEELHLFMQVEASIVYNGQYAYEAELVCECGEGTELDTMLLPMAQSRLVAYAEIPAALAQDADAQWSLQLEHNGESLVIDLK